MPNAGRPDRQQRSGPLEIKHVRLSKSGQTRCEAGIDCYSDPDAGEIPKGHVVFDLRPSWGTQGRMRHACISCVQRFVHIDGDGDEALGDFAGVGAGSRWLVVKALGLWAAVLQTHHGRGSTEFGTAIATAEAANAAVAAEQGGGPAAVAAAAAAANGGQKKRKKKAEAVAPAPAAAAAVVRAKRVTKKPKRLESSGDEEEEEEEDLEKERVEEEPAATTADAAAAAAGGDDGDDGDISSGYDGGEDADEDKQRQAQGKGAVTGEERK